jgi:hypothetical protein
MVSACTGSAISHRTSRLKLGILNLVNSHPVADLSLSAVRLRLMVVILLFYSSESLMDCVEVSEIALTTYPTMPCYCVNVHK